MLQFSLDQETHRKGHYLVVINAVYRNNLKNREFGKEAPQNFDAERATIAEGQGASEHQNSEAKPTEPKPDSSGCFGITPKRNIYKADLEGAATEKQKAAVALLIKEGLRFLGIPFLSSAADTAVLNRVRVNGERVKEVLKALGASSSLYHGGKKVFIDPFAAVDLVLEVKNRTVQGKVRGEDLQDADFVFTGEPSFFIWQGTLFFFKEGVSRRLKMVHPSAKVLTEEDLFSFYEEWGSDPYVLWKDPIPQVQEIEPTPILKLTDKTGTCANLWMDYSLKGKVAYHDVCFASWRNKKAEEFWEKDLLETGFGRKFLNISRYYCPLDKVAKSLTFLLELGWKIVDAQERVVARQNGAAYEVEEKEGKLLFRGKISFHTHVADVSEVAGAFQRRERFLSLGEGHVGLLDEEKIDPALKDLFEEPLIKEGVLLDKRKVNLLEPLKEKLGVQLPPILRAAELSPPASSFQGTLHPYQQKGVDWLSFLYEHRFSGLLADSMGLGKTVQVIAFLSRQEFPHPLLVLAPTSLLFNWRVELQRFLPSLPVYVHSGKERLSSLEALASSKVIVTSYALLRQDAELLTSLTYSVVILDEAQHIKNPDAQISRLVFALRADFRLALTGTPIENRLEELWSLFYFLLPGLLGERKEFNAKMVSAQSDPRYLHKLKKTVRPFILRRGKEHVAHELPPKQTHIVWTEMLEDQQALYEEWMAKNRAGLLKKIAQEGAEAHRMEILEAILRLRQICCHPVLVDAKYPGSSSKLDLLLSDLEGVVNEGGKALVYSQFTSMLRLIEKEVKARGYSYVLLDGSSKDREALIEKFQKDKDTRLFLLSLKAGGVGLNLTAADYVFLFDPWWNDAVEDQAIDRAHRLGRTGSVIAKRYLTPYSIEEKMLRLKSHKADLAKSLLEDKEVSGEWTLEELQELLT